MKKTIVENVGCEVGAIWGDHLSLALKRGFVYSVVFITLLWKVFYGA